ncbi:hypothetical protein [uncultured Jatrophihabitans sp.]|uniref:hypothetical protein n=1 Tax=uncultured Jatrophihabitans sp. TaxID=1610747 RepID=UPI0035C95A97
MWTLDRDDGEFEPRRAPYVDGAWGRTANPNTVDGELQNMAAFGSGLSRMSAPRRAAAKAVVWLILIGVALTIVFGAIDIFRAW